VIRSISLENWRAYRHLAVDVAPGTTFLVAANGVGKTSLLEAVRWALSAGNVAEKPDMIRQGHDTAFVGVSIGTEDGDLHVRRTLQLKRGRLKSELDVRLDGQQVGDARTRELLEGAWAADARFVSRTAFLTEDLRREGDEPDLRAHLCAAYSLDELQRSLDAVGQSLMQANRAVKTRRTELKATEAELTIVHAEHQQRLEAVAEARAALEQARERQSLTRAALDEARSSMAQRAAASDWDTRRTALIHDAEQILDSDTRITDPDLGVAAREQALADQVEQLRQQQADLRARVTAIEDALSTLHQAGAACPVCLRKLDNRSRQHAEARHEEVLTEIRGELSRVDLSAATRQLQAVHELSRRIAALSDRPVVPDSPPPDDLVGIERQASVDVEAAAATLREAEIAEQAAAARAQEVVDELSEAQRLTREYRHVALLEAAREALDRTITTVLDQQLGPMAEEVNRRWQAVFPDRPHLRMRPDGHISRDVGGDPLDFAAFSAGEQTVAKLMMRLTTLLTTTTVPFCWIDEPLEHLDPRSRQLVGSTLAHLSAPGGLEQIFVTTYEEPLARRLAELQPERVRVEYLRTEPVS
jgi:DNA repair exonuclease SbcCD ATPase subunit